MLTSANCFGFDLFVENFPFFNIPSYTFLGFPFIFAYWALEQLGKFSLTTLSFIPIQNTEFSLFILMFFRAHSSFRKNFEFSVTP